MASGDVLKSLRNVYAKTEVEVRKWEGHQERLVSLLGTISNILERIPALQSPANFGQLQHLPGYQQKLLGKQLMATEELLRESQACLRDMEVTLQGVARIVQNAENTIRQDKRLTPAARAVAAGPVPSIEQCLAGLRLVRDMLSDELRLQQALAAEVRYGQQPEELQAVLQAARMKPNIDADKMRDTFYVVAATEERRM